MNSIEEILFTLLMLATAAGLVVLLRQHGLGGTLRLFGERIRSIGAFSYVGTGVRLLGIHPQGRGQYSTTFWLTVFFVPVLPLKREIVRFVEPAGNEAKWLPLQTTPLSAREVRGTYLAGWVGFPALLFGPFYGGILLSKVADALQALGHSPPAREIAHVAGNGLTLFGVLLALAGLPWFFLTLWRLLTWDTDRKRPTAREGQPFRAWPWLRSTTKN